MPDLTSTHLTDLNWKRPKLLIFVFLNKIYQFINESIHQNTGLGWNTDNYLTGVKNFKLVVEESLIGVYFDCVFWALLSCNHVNAILPSPLIFIMNNQRFGSWQNENMSNEFPFFAIVRHNWIHFLWLCYFEQLFKYQKPEIGFSKAGYLISCTFENSHHWRMKSRENYCSQKD